MNKSLTILELSGNRVSDELLKQVSDLLTRNKNGDPIVVNQVGLKKSIFKAPSQP